MQPAGGPGGHPGLTPQQLAQQQAQQQAHQQAQQQQQHPGLQQQQQQQLRHLQQQQQQAMMQRQNAPQQYHMQNAGGRPQQMNQQQLLHQQQLQQQRAAMAAGQAAGQARPQRAMPPGSVPGTGMPHPQHQQRPPVGPGPAGRPGVPVQAHGTPMGQGMRMPGQMGVQGVAPGAQQGMSPQAAAGMGHQRPAPNAGTISNALSQKPYPLSHKMTSSTPRVGEPSYPTPPRELVGKRKIQELIQQMGVNEVVDTDVERILLELADDFVESVTTFGCSLAKHRKSDTLEVKDLQIPLDRHWNIQLPGIIPMAALEEGAHPVKRPMVTDVHRQRSVQIRKSQVQLQQQASRDARKMA